MSIGRRAINLVARPFRTAGRVNRQVLLSMMQDVEGPVLELGPGGRPLIALLDKIPTDQKHVIEFEGAMSVSREAGFQCHVQDLGRDRWDLPDASVGLVVSNQVLEHVPRTDHVIRESLRVLRPGGKFLVSVPNQGALAYVLMLLATFNPPMNMVSDEYYGLGNPFSGRRFQRSSHYGTEAHGHLRLFTVRGMQDLLRVHGASPLRAHGGTWGVPLLGRALARVFPWYGLFTIVLAERADDAAGAPATTSVTP